MPKAPAAEEYETTTRRRVSDDQCSRAKALRAGLLLENNVPHVADADACTHTLSRNNHHTHHAITTTHSLNNHYTHHAITNSHSLNNHYTHHAITNSHSRINSDTLMVMLTHTHTITTTHSCNNECVCVCVCVCVMCVRALCM